MTISRAHDKKVPHHHVAHIVYAARRRSYRWGTFSCSCRPNHNTCCAFAQCFFYPVPHLCAWMSKHRGHAYALESSFNLLCNHGRYSIGPIYCGNTHLTAWTASLNVPTRTWPTRHGLIVAIYASRYSQSASPSARVRNLYSCVSK